MGEVEDIAFTLPQTMAKLQTMIHNSRFLNLLKDVDGAVVKDFVNYSEEAIKAEGFVKAVGKKFGALEGQYLHKDVIKDIGAFQRGFFGEENNYAKISSMFLTYYKKTHTVYNQGTHLNNVLSSATMATMAGLNPKELVSALGVGFKVANRIPKIQELKAKLMIDPKNKELLDELKKFDTPSTKMWYELKERGLFGRNQINDVLGKYYQSSTLESKSQNKLISAIQKVDEKLTDWYGSEDDIFKFTLAKHFIEKDKMSIDKAIMKVNENLPDYSKTMAFIPDMLRRTGVVPFMSWTYHATPILARQMVEHPIKALTIFALISTPYALSSLNPINDEETPNGFGFKRIPINTDGNKVTTLKTDKWLPHGELLNWLPFTNENNALIPENLRSMFVSSPYMTLYGYANNTNPYYNRKITQKEGWEKFLDTNAFLIESLATPDVLDKSLEFGKSFFADKEKRRNDKVIEPSSNYEALAKLFGLNIKTYDKEALKEEVQQQKIKDEEDK